MPRLKSMRKKVYDYKAGKISQWQLWPGAAIIAVRLLWEHIKDFASLPGRAGESFTGDWVDVEVEWRGQVHTKSKHALETRFDLFQRNIKNLMDKIAKRVIVGGKV